MQQMYTQNPLLSNTNIVFKKRETNKQKKQHLDTLLHPGAH